jgi:hypothetical protein
MLAYMHTSKHTHSHTHTHTLLVSVAPNKTYNGVNSRQGCREEKEKKDEIEHLQFIVVDTAAQSIDSVSPVVSIPRK